MQYKFFGLLLSILCVAPVCGQCTIQRSQVHQTYQAYHAPTVTAAYSVYDAHVPVVAIPVIVPAYGVGYGQSLPAGLAANDPELVRLRQEIDRLNQHNNFMMTLLMGRQPQQLPPQQQPQLPQQQLPSETVPTPPVNKEPSKGASPGKVPTFGSTYVQKNCAVCHEQAVAKTKGDGFVMFTGTRPVNISEKQRLDAIDRVTSGDMPKGREMSDQDGTFVILELSRWDRIVTTSK